MSVNKEQLIALAGLLQAAYLVDQIARTGKYPEENFNPLVQSLFQFDSDDCESIYGGIHTIDLGLRILIDIFNGNEQDRYRATIRYALGILHLQKKLAGRTDLMDILHSRLQHIQFKSDHFSNDINDICSSIAATYKDTVSTFSFRIQVNGSLQQLQDDHNANKIRALLLAGIRAGVLWRQVGGRRWQLLFNRRKLTRLARDLLTD